MTRSNRSLWAPTAVLAVALVLAATGGAVAGSLVTSAQIKDGTVHSRDVKNATLQVKDLAPAARGALRGPAGPPGVSGLQVVQNGVPAPAQADTFARANCPSGKRPIGVAGFLSGRNDAVQTSIDAAGGVVWTYNNGMNAATLFVQVVCAFAS